MRRPTDSASSPGAEGLARYPSPRTLLDRHGLRAKRAWGQNFLGDANLLARIANLACGPGVPAVIEIGAGLGHLTARLLERAERVVAIEQDRDMLAVLRAELGGHPGLELIEADALSVDYAALAQRLPGAPPVAGNLPYNISSPILFRLLRAGDALGRWTFLLQREVAERLAAGPGSRTYGALSVHVGLERRVTLPLRVHRSAFLPPPNVDSALAAFEPLQQPLRPSAEDQRRLLARVVDDAFSGRRKTLVNALRGRGWSGARALLQAAEIDPGLRAEALAPADYVRLAAAAERSCSLPG